MKRTLALLAVILLGAVGLYGWYKSSSGVKKPKDKTTLKTLVARARMETTDEKPAGRREIVAAANRGRRGVDAPSVPVAADPDFKVGADFVFGKDSGFLDEMDVEISDTMRQILEEIQTAQDRGRGKRNSDAVLAAVRKLLDLIASGEHVPLSAKQAALNAVTMNGGGLRALPELVEMIADPDPEMSAISLERLQELIWDFDTKPAELADATLQVLKLTEDREILEPFVIGLADIPDQEPDALKLKIETTLAIIDSGNKEAFGVLSENVDFILDDFDGHIQTREDVVNYATERGVEVNAAVGGVANGEAQE